ncbi:MAG: Cysteine--tRNA ligase, partial [Frankiales bacterium]|nr:Cysteine--tRNA ligase [Frankiales bacterium]
YVRGSTVYARSSAAAARAGLDEAAALRLAEEYGDEPGDAAKEHPLDTAVWRGANEGEPQWPSPWGGGRPGWHAQCAAMVLGTYGASIDLHAGGADLAFPHHATEAYLAETVTGVAPFARAWLRPGTVRLGDEKMAKSTGNLVLVDDLLKQHSAGALRLLCLNRSWRDGWTFTTDGLEAAAERLSDLYGAAGRGGGDTAVDAVDAALLDDLDVPRAVAIALESGGAAARRLIDVLQLQ